MGKVVKFQPTHQYSKTVTKIIDGVQVEFIEIDELPLIEQSRYFHLSSKQKQSRGEASPRAVVVPLRG